MGNDFRFAEEENGTKKESKVIRFVKDNWFEITIITILGSSFAFGTAYRIKSVKKAKAAKKELSNNMENAIIDLVSYSLRQEGQIEAYKEMAKNGIISEIKG